MNRGWSIAVVATMVAFYPIKWAMGGGVSPFDFVGFPVWAMILVLELGKGRR